MSVNPAEILLSPYPLGDLKLKNRIVMAPLTRTRVKSLQDADNKKRMEHHWWSCLR